MLAALALQEVDALGQRPRVLVRPLADQRVEHVGHRDDARDQRNVVAVQAVRIAGAVVLLVMAERDDRAHRQVLRRAALQDVVADARVRAHHLLLGLRQRAFLQQDRVGDADLADVVHRRGDLEHVHGLGAEPEVLRRSAPSTSPSASGGCRSSCRGTRRPSRASTASRARARGSRTPTCRPGTAARAPGRTARSCGGAARAGSRSARASRARRAA